MIIPIIGKDDKPMGTASVVRVGKGARDFSVEFYFQPWVTIREEARLRLVRDLITIARNQEKAGRN